MLVLAEKEIRRLIEIEELIAALEQAHIQFSIGKAVMPVRQVVPLPDIGGRMTSMPAYLAVDRALGMKVVTYFKDNPRLGLPAILATIHLYSAETGKLTAILDGTYITAIRTACASAMATKALANNETPVLAILGAGVQARAHIETLSKARRLEKIKVYSPSGERARKLKNDLESTINVAIEPAASAEAAVRGADLVVTATTAATPILEGAWLKPGAHVNAIGSHRPDLRELDGATLKAAKLVVDSREAMMTECGDVLLAVKEGMIEESHASVEIGEVLAGHKVGRTDRSDITIYKSVGIAIQDVAAAALVYHKAVRQKVGVEVDL
ncbi:MAG TPA: ornithine cyclodeaminase family protein [Verrucomicrobiae bacterium]|jgi:ornithine cyclodeaminase/alanine dehydrogenase-like protein (mu-crystallin family)|nr:ornithine cyclodeaminase family protein [Verrucomicrobiae bacterium]